MIDEQMFNTINRQTLFIFSHLSHFNKVTCLPIHLISIILTMLPQEDLTNVEQIIK